MHEVAIANEVIEAVQAEAGRRPGVRLSRIGIRLGELAGVSPDALSFCFEVLTGGTTLAGVILDIEHCPRRQQCPGCRSTFVVEDLITTCPVCRNPATECVGGSELELAYLEVEEP